MDRNMFAPAGLAAMAAAFLVHLTMMRSDEIAKLRDHIDVVVIGTTATLLAILVDQHPEWLI
ncbi:MAG: hypothetical protein EOP69_00870 [Spirochaetia bacterium]|jgi:hypothetical protein|nr:MAG: hypothetical protein EOP69_00870 [Spirochaetia bacterium]